jgi:hypothetical protein
MDRSMRPPPRSLTTCRIASGPALGNSATLVSNDGCDRSGFMVKAGCPENSTINGSLQSCMRAAVCCADNPTAA